MGLRLQKASWGRQLWAGSWAAPLPPPSGPAITGLGAAWGHRPRCQGRSPLPIQPGAHPGGCLCHLRSPCHRPRLPSGLPWGAPCWDPASVPASPPGLRRRGQSQGVCVPPLHGMPRRAPALALTWYCGVEAEGSSPAKSDSESSSCSMRGTDYGVTTSLLPQEPNPARSCLPGLEPAPPLLAHPPVCTLPGACSSPWGCAGRRCSLLARRPGSPQGRRCPTSASAPWT